MVLSKFTIKPVEKKRKKRHITLIALIAIIILGISTLFGAKYYIISASQSKTYDKVENVPERKTGLLLGCRKNLYNGHRNHYFHNRVCAAAKLYLAGKIQHIIVSGDNGNRSYNEPADMKKSLVNLGVPAEDIYCDYAGFRTLDSVVRAREIFNQNDILIISQKFHNQRAIFLAQKQGINAIGFNAKDVETEAGFYTNCREYLACTKAILDVYVLDTQPRFLGEKVVIGEQCSRQ